MGHEWKKFGSDSPDLEFRTGKYKCDKCGKIDYFYHNMAPDPNIKVLPYKYVKGFQQELMTYKYSCEQLTVKLVEDA